MTGLYELTAADALLLPAHPAPRWYPCPACHAEPGRACRSQLPSIVAGSHAPRLDAAIRDHNRRVVQLANAGLLDDE